MRMERFSMALRPAVMSLALVLAAAPRAQAGPIGFAENFEGQTAGSFPAGWLDVGLVDPSPPNSPIPSAIVVNTTDAFGNPTKALATVDAIAPSQGIYRSVPLSSRYQSTADVRVDRFSDNSVSPEQDWAMAVGVNRFNVTPVADPAFVPSAQIYASSLTRSWRIFLVTDNVAADVDLGVPVVLGRWYRVSVDLDVNAGTFGSRIVDVATGTVLVDRVDSVDALDLLDGNDFGGLWTPAVDGVFDTEAFFDGELSPGTTIATLAVVDNIDQVVTPVPEPATLLLLGPGLLALAGAAWRARGEV